jgi:broad specificity phosphatase PhoE
VKIGLVRHFKVKSEQPARWITAQEIHQWLQDYDCAEIEMSIGDLGSHSFSRCFSSNCTRAVRTAEALYPGRIEQTQLLREPNIRCFQTGSLKLPYAGWRWVLRLAWLTSHRSQLEAKQGFLQNIRTFASTLSGQTGPDTLIVSHAGVMIFLRKELLKQGFRGPKFTIPEHGRLYLFEK